MMTVEEKRRKVTAELLGCMKEIMSSRLENHNYKQAMEGNSRSGFRHRGKP